MSAIWLFVYGSLRRDGAGCHHPLLAQARFAGAATVPGILYRVDWYPGLVPHGDARGDARGDGRGDGRGDAHGDGRVRGELFELPLPAADRMLQALDDYEGGGFRRRKVGATLDDTVSPDSETHDAWTYTYVGPVHALERIATGDFGVAPEHRARP